MREFVYGTDAQFQMLDQALFEGKNYKYAERRLPAACSPNTACLWFGKINDSYRICIDKGIVSTEGSEEFKCFLERGEAVFASMNDLSEFLRSLKSLFPAPEPIQKDYSGIDVDVEEATGTLNSSEENPSEMESVSADDILDRKLLSAIRMEREKTKTVWPEEIADRLKKKVFGQDDVIDELADKVVINQMRTEKKLLVVSFLGPTATGKSETAKSLAEVMSDIYKKKYGFIEIAGSEFIGEHTVHRFFGAPPGYVGHGGATLLEPVRKNPYHVIVINEIEKADEKILIGLMEAIDTGMLGMADNTKPIDLNRCILLFTSNIPIDQKKYEEASSFERAEMCKDAFTKHCGKPEISGKIGNFLVFHSLSEDAVTDIIIKFIREELDSYNMTLAHVDEYLMADFLKQRTKYGARGIRDQVNAAVGRHLLKNRNLSALEGKRITLSGSIDNIEFAEVQEGGI